MLSCKFDDLPYRQLQERIQGFQLSTIFAKSSFCMFDRIMNSTLNILFDTLTKLIKAKY